MTPIALPKEWDHETDIIIVGAGTAGLPAAMLAKAAGAEVVVLESTKSMGGSGCLIMAGGAFAGTSYQKKLGIEDSPEQLYKDGIEIAEGTPEIWRAYADNQLDTFEWLLSIGCKPSVEDKLIMPPGHRAARLHVYEGMKAMATIERAAKEKEVDIRLGHRAKRLIYDFENDRVVGIAVQVKNKLKYFKARKGILLATGGFGRNKEMISEYGRRFVDCIPLMAPGHKGDGLKMSLDLGAATQDIGNSVVASLAACTTTHSDRGYFAVMAGGIAVNVNGERFYDESCPKGYYGHLTDAGMDQPGKVFWFIYDSLIRDVWMVAPHVKSWKSFEGNTYEELAENAGLNAENFAACVNRYNEDIESEGSDTVLGRKFLTMAGGELQTLSTPPYYAIKCETSITSFKGGLKLNSRFQVVNVYGEPIRGLYAAGEVAGGLFSKGAYMGGVNWASSMTNGRVAVRNLCFENA
ncbi:MAG: FAD-binding protein [Desulfobacterium sp.]